MWTINSFHQITAFVSLVAGIYLLSVSLKDLKFALDHPSLSGRLAKFVLVGIISSQLWYLLIPSESESYWTLFNLSITLGLISLALSYQRKYTKLKIEFLDYSSFIHIPTDRYSEEIDGVALRSYLPAGTILLPYETDLLAMVQDFDLRRFVVVFFRVRGGSKFPDHFHPTPEFTFLLSGKAQMVKNYPALTPNRSLYIPPNTEHFFDAIEDCIGVSLIEK